MYFVEAFPGRVLHRLELQLVSSTIKGLVQKLEEMTFSVTSLGILIVTMVFRQSSAYVRSRFCDEEDVEKVFFVHVPYSGSQPHFSALAELEAGTQEQQRQSRYR